MSGIYGFNLKVRAFTSPLAGEVDTRSVAGEGEGITFLCVDRKVFPTPSPAAVAATSPARGEVKSTRILKGEEYKKQKKSPNRRLRLLKKMPGDALLSHE